MFEVSAPQFRRSRPIKPLKQTCAGQLGLQPAKTDGERPTQALTSRATLSALPDEVSVRQISSGYEHALALSEGGKVLASGIGTDGQLGAGNDSDQHAFAQLSLPAQLAEEGVAAVEAGADTSAILSGQGNVWTFGNSVGLAAFRSICDTSSSFLVTRSMLKPSKVARLTGYCSLRL